MFHIEKYAAMYADLLLIAIAHSLAFKSSIDSSPYSHNGRYDK